MADAIQTFSAIYIILLMISLFAPCVTNAFEESPAASCIDSGGASSVFFSVKQALGGGNIGAIIGGMLAFFTALISPLFWTFNVGLTFNIILYVFRVIAFISIYYIIVPTK